MEYDGEQENKEFHCYKLKKKITKFEVLDRVLNLNDHLAEAYHLRNKFLKVIKTSTFDTIENNLKAWICEVDQSCVKEYDIAINTMLNWKQEIINSFIIHPKTGKTMNNAGTEGSNNFCKVIKRVSYGYKDFELMRARILYCNRKTIQFKSTSIKDKLNYEKSDIAFYLDEHTPLTFDEAIDYLRDLLHQEQPINSQLSKENKDLYSTILKLKKLIEIILDKYNLPF